MGAKDAPALLLVNIRHVLTHWMAALCHVKTGGVAQLNTLKKNSLGRSAVEKRLLKDMRTCMQNHQSGKYIG